MDPNLLSIICCPITREKLSMATSKQLDFINAEIANSNLTKLDGSIAEKPQSKALINAAKTLLYPIEEDIQSCLKVKQLKSRGWLFENLM